jgi:hypothetical protein
MVPERGFPPLTIKLAMGGKKGWKGKDRVRESELAAVLATRIA